MKQRKLRKSIEWTLTIIAMILSSLLIMLDDFELRALPALFGIAFLDIEIIRILIKYGRGLAFEKEDN